MWIALWMAGGAWAGPQLDLQVGSDWAIVEETSTELRLRHKTTADGLLIVFEATPERGIGVAPIQAGRTLEVVQGATRLPTFSWPFPAHALTAVRVEQQGPDLLVRLEGPPLSTVSDHPDAPDDPVLSWVRVRPRGSTWRIALRGVHRWLLPEVSETTHRGSDRVLETAWGRFEVRTDADAIQGHQREDVRVWDTSPSIEEARPYVQTGMTWTPLSP